MRDAAPEDSATSLPDRCPVCSGDWSRSLPPGLCPACLLSLGLGGDASDEEDGDFDEAAPNFQGRGRSASSLRVVEPLGRGGVGLVYRGRDELLGRDLAIKVLRGRCRDRPGMLRRFLDEARIVGSLQHPGIVPIYELGRCDDGLPFIAMKLVDGTTLASELAARADPSQDQERFLGVLQQVCRAVAYAHSRRVIHRDLKPSNVMLGAFGEVQVMDWGFAKALDRNEPERSDSRGWDDWSHATGDGSRAGAVLGTPAYMAPEQARGEVGRVGERADVFGLGSMLCEVLTGRPAHHGPTPQDVLARARAGATAEARERLAASGADAELIALAGECLDADPDRRPQDASAVADRLLGHLQSVGERLRVAQLARAQADARADLERSRRRLVVSLGMAVLALCATIAVGLAAWVERLQNARSLASAAIGRVEALRDEARCVPSGDPERWEVAQAAAQQAKDLLERDADARTRGRLEALAAEVVLGLEAARRDLQLTRRLDEIRCHEGVVNMPMVDDDYGEAFRSAGLDPDGQAVEALGQAVARRPPDAATAIAAALDDWALVRRKRAAEEFGRRGESSDRWRRLLAAARIARPHPWVDAVRAAIAADDGDALVALAEAAGLEARPASGLCLLARVSPARPGEAPEMTARRSLRILEAGHRAHPGDFWINITLASKLLSDGDEDVRKGSLRYAAAAVAARPDSAAARIVQGMSLKVNEDFDGAANEFESAIRLRPSDYFVHLNLGMNLLDRGQPERAEGACREAVRIKPDCGDCRFMLGYSLAVQGKLDEAIAAYREALAVDPDDEPARERLQDLLDAGGLLEEAEALAREGADRPGPPAASARAFVRFGHALLRRDPASPAAEAAFREAIRRDPKATDSIPALAEILLVREGHDAARAALDGLRASMGSAEGDGLRKARRLADLDAQASRPGGDDGPPSEFDIDDRLAFAAVLRGRGDVEASDRVYTEVISERPELLVDHSRTVPFDAARSAILASLRSPGAETDPARGEGLRRKALGWLRADMETWRRHLDMRSSQCRFHVARCIARWRSTRDFAVVRDRGRVASLSDGERAEWDALWHDVDALSERATSLDFRDAPVAAE